MYVKMLLEQLDFEIVTFANYCINIFIFIKYPNIVHVLFQGSRCGFIPNGGPIMAPGASTPGMASGAPVMAPGNPVMAPGTPVMAPGNPVMAPGNPVMAPGNPVMAPGFIPDIQGQAAYFFKDAVYSKMGNGLRLYC